MFYLFINTNIINNLNVVYLFKTFLSFPDVIFYASGMCLPDMFGVTEMKVVYLHNVY